ncbi:MAG: 16S rRNA (cytosine(967)-C(5))-methyltransferase RsmB [Lawsonibacter sp.]|nr:16S rRNA (cytosine(967)-C(5))-methyltransferase RsmB [Lawsonibacter sp.]
MDAREAAMLALNAGERQGGWSEGELKKRLAAAGLDSRDAALATRLCYGVLQNRILLDFRLGQFSRLPLGRMESKVRQILRLGACQLLFFDRIPHSAAVNSAVALTKRYSKNPRAAGMVNGVLRNLERNLDRLPAIPKGDISEYFSILYSHPQWLVDMLLPLLGEKETEELLTANNTPPPTSAVVNPLRTTPEALLVRLAEEGAEAELHPWLEGCLLLGKTGDLEALPAFQQGLLHIQDPASRLAVLASGASPGMRVLDVCAAPGGKSFSAAMQMEGKGEVLACDLHPHKKRLLEAGARRLGLSCLTAGTADGRVFRPEWDAAFDLVLVDAPCSGLGVIRKKPDIREKDPAALEGLPPVQKAILANAARYVRPGGALLYSTCTLLTRENEDVVHGFLAERPDFKAEAFTLPGPVGVCPTGSVTLWPQRHGTDGFFLCKLRREG